MRIPGSMSRLTGANTSCRQSMRSEEHTSELQSQSNLVCRLLLEKKKILHLPPLLLPPSRPRLRELTADVHIREQSPHNGDSPHAQHPLVRTPESPVGTLLLRAPH